MTGVAETPASEVVLEARDLGKRYGKRTAVAQVSFSVRKGDVYGFLGPNGAGKTTTIRMLLRLIRRDQGVVRLFGEDLDAKPLQLLARVGALVEEPAFYPYLTGRQNLAFFGRLSGRLERGRIDEVLGLVGLGDRGDDKVTAYSQGMRQRLGIAQALLTRPQLVFLDEPTNGLDPPGIEEMRKLLLRLARDEGVTIVLSSHLLHEVEMLCNRVLILDRGRLVVEGRVDELLQTDQVRLEVGSDTPPRVTELAREMGIVESGLGSAADRVVFSCPTDRVAELNRALVERGISVTALVPRRPTLEEYFRSHVGQGAAAAAAAPARPSSAWSGRHPAAGASPEAAA